MSKNEKGFNVDKFDELNSQLASQYSRLSAVINTVVDGIVTIDKKGVIETFNPAAERIFGYRKDQVIGHNVKMLMPEPYTAEHDYYLNSYLTTGSAKVIGLGREVVGQRADGALFPMELSVSEMQVDGEVMFTGIVRDISDIVEQKSLLGDQVARIKAIIETVIDGIITIDEYGVIESFNPAAEKIFGYKTDEVIANNIKMLMPKPYQQEHDQYLNNYKVSGIKKVIGSGREVLGQRKDGSVFPLSLSISEMNINNKKMFTGIVRDITEQKKYEIALSQYRETLEEKVKQRTFELENATQQAQAANKAKSKFLSRMSHELRTPLNAIIGFTQLLDDEELTEIQRDNLKEIALASKALMAMVDDILQINAIQNKNINLKLEEVSLNEAVKESLKLLTPKALGKSISLDFNHEEEFFVTADYSKLKQVITNLIDNAINYNFERGTVRILIETSEEQVKISFIDSGKGISKEQLKTIFSPFERASDEYTGEEGIGIGLTIVRELVQAMDGVVGASSTQGKGSTFYFTLPLLRIVGTDEKIASRVLYIEDNITNRKLMKRMISRLDGIEYYESVDGNSGIEVANELLPSLILLDINLPDISGYEVFQAIRDHDKTKNIPIIAVSANAMEADKETAKALGFTDYITKPIEMSILKESIDVALGTADKENRPFQK
ncbi:PAS domain-containing hybrid sensor histidine kinase/response regulator [Pseudoalteromonas sp. R3]|uniref:hybrid sensor histidine kinase/response regulator n=2 Tax=Pseudoalteromonas sp. R3 TaxID=1709477 RepID=UPI0006B44869|nr:PAS domain-containing hybrid sensor histidine kinase/response regulator [Pseudoalteromonas sp. R3]